MVLNKSIQQFQERFDSYRATLLKENFNKINEAKNGLLKYLCEVECPAAYIPFNSFPSSRMPQSCTVPPYIAIGHTDIPVSKDSEYSSVSVPFLLPICKNGAFLFEGDLGLTGIPNLFQMTMLRLSLSIPLELCRFHMVDCDYGRSFSFFNSLQNPKIQKTLYGADQVRNLFMEMEGLMRSMYSGEMGRYDNLVEYNRNNPDSAKPYNFIFIDDFPISCASSYQEIDQLKSMINNGNALNAGIYIFINYSLKDTLPRDLDIDYFKKNCSIITSKANGESSIDLLDVFKKLSHSNILETNMPDNFDEITALLNLEDEAEVKDITPRQQFYDIPESEMWASSSVSVTNIPVGLSESGDIVEITFSQKDAQNSAIVVGKSGFGKSRFLHSLILNAALRYSPDELEMYLLDLSGVEFDVYAKMNLPHARAIVPEADREMGCYILREIRQEGERREALCREYGVDNVEALRKINPHLIVPRIIAIIDEFQVLFEYLDDIQKQSSKDIDDIIRRFRKYSINIILSSQKAYEASRLSVAQIGIRVAFSSENKDARLVGMDYLNLDNGCFVYNGKTGDPKYNQKAKTLYVEDKTNESIGGVAKAMKVINCITEAHTYEHKDTFVFRGDTLPEFNPALINASDCPNEVRLYFGQSLSIRNSDIYVPLDGYSEDNVLLIGGEAKITQEICMFTMMSAISAYSNREKAAYYVFNFLRPDNPLYNHLDAFKGLDSDIIFADKTNDIVDNLKNIHQEMENRKENYSSDMKDIYIFVYAMELGQAFKAVKGQIRTVKSEAMQLLGDILRDGPVGHIYTILQIDNYRSISQIGEDIVDCFNYRIVLQMDPVSSRKVIASDVASAIYDSKKPWTKYSGYYYNRKNDLKIKFRPYNSLISKD